MFRGSAILLVLALVLLTSQYSYAYHDYEDYGNHRGVIDVLDCTVVGRYCNSNSDCCSGLRCQCPFLDHNCRCQYDHRLYRS